MIDRRTFLKAFSGVSVLFLVQSTAAIKIISPEEGKIVTEAVSTIGMHEWSDILKELYLPGIRKRLSNESCTYDAFSGEGK